jgi:uncharacterized membrane protein
LDTEVLPKPETTQVKNPENKETRALALDALRGIAILAMILSSRIPYGSLPGWMYHAQNPPPSHAFNPLVPGITWVDLVFPFFIFAMGAAIPFALSRQIQNGKKRSEIVLSVFKRGFLLALFAILIQHLRPTVINAQPDLQTNIISLVGFVLLFFLFVRLKKSISKKAGYFIRGLSVTGLFILLFFLRYPDGSGFSLYRSDIIILVLANVAVSGSLIWLFSQQNLLIRLSWLGILLAIRLSANIEGSWVNWIWNEIQVPWLFKLYYLQYLFIAIPGTVIGDLLKKWLDGSHENRSSTDHKTRSITEASVFLAFVVLIVSGLYAREIIPVLILTFFFSVSGYIYFSTQKDWFYKELFNWFIYLMVIGLLFESFEGGIQKGRPTLSFYFVTSALSICMLIFFSLLIYSAGIKFKLLVQNGQNPMLAYAGGTNLLNPLIYLLFINHLLNYISAVPWLGALSGFIITYILALIVGYFTRKKVFWRT